MLLFFALFPFFFSFSFSFFSPHFFFPFFIQGFWLKFCVSFETEEHLGVAAVEADASLERIERFDVHGWKLQEISNRLEGDPARRRSNSFCRTLALRSDLHRRRQPRFH